MVKSKILFFITGFIFICMTLSGSSVTVTYDLKKIGKIASNQIAIWVEDSSGKIVKNLFVTRFTGRGGYKIRPLALNGWVTKSDWKNATKEDVDAITAATQKPGSQKIIWDCKDAKGNAVVPGKYFICFEGNIFWEKEVFAKCEVAVGDKEMSVKGIMTYSTVDTEKEGVLFSNVTATFKP